MEEKKEQDSGRGIVPIPLSNVCIRQLESVGHETRDMAEGKGWGVGGMGGVTGTEQRGHMQVSGQLFS